MFALIITHFLFAGTQVTTVGSIEHTHLAECNAAATAHTDATHSGMCVRVQDLDAHTEGCKHIASFHFDTWGALTETDDLAGYGLDTWECGRWAPLR